MFSIEKQTAGQIWLKFGTELVLEGGKVLGGGVGPVRKRVRAASGDSAMHFGKNWKDLGPMFFWSHCHSL